MVRRLRGGYEDEESGTSSASPLLEPSGLIRDGIDAKDENRF